MSFVVFLVVQYNTNQDTEKKLISRIREPLLRARQSMNQLLKAYYCPRPSGIRKCITDSKSPYHLTGDRDISKDGDADPEYQELCPVGARKLERMLAVFAKSCPVFNVNVLPHTKPHRC
jgi:hypothetical protein